MPHHRCRSGFFARIQAVRQQFQENGQLLVPVPMNEVIHDIDNRRIECGSGQRTGNVRAMPCEFNAVVGFALRHARVMTLPPGVGHWSSLSHFLAGGSLDLLPGALGLYWALVADLSRHKAYRSWRCSARPNSKRKVSARANL
jgi:hypothetical protein